MNKNPQLWDIEQEPLVKDHDLNERQRILQRLMYHPNSTFNQMWAKVGRSNRFAYHVKSLEKEGLVEKSADGTYQLTHEGKKLVAYFESQTASEVKLPLLVAVVVVCDGDKFLMVQRDREPFREFWGFHGGKVQAGEYLLESAAKKVLEETGLECDLELKGMFSTKTYHNDKLGFTHQLMILKGINPRGKLLINGSKGENKWVTKKELDQLQRFPNIPHLLNIVEGKRFRWIEADRFQKEDKFIGMKILRDQII